jgi:hypothetical protein
VEHLYYDGFAPTRARPWLQRTSVSTRLLNALGERVLGGQEGLERMSPRIGRLLMEPIVVTAVTRRSD